MCQLLRQVFVVSFCASVAVGYRPVFLMHGLTATPETMDSLKAMILTAHPGTPVYNIDAFNEEVSMTPMWLQVHGVYKIIAAALKDSHEGAIFIGHSQGGLVLRGILEYYTIQKITFITLASPLAGQFGDVVGSIIPFIKRKDIYKYCYLDLATFSVCDWWKDPTKMSMYRESSKYLYPLESATNSSYKSNFEGLQNLVLIGGPQDGIVEPWQSSQLGFYDENMNIIEYKDQQYYMEDSFGLKTLNESGRLHIHTVKDITHFQIHKKQSVFDCCIKKWLD